jgi:adenylosuccinate synthase
MPKFQPAAAHEAEPVILSENRQALAELIADRDAMMDAAQAETESSAKLGTIHNAVGPARAALAAFDAEQALGLSNWAKGLTTSRPKSDAARRAELAAELADAELASAAAKAAQDACQSAVERLSHPLSQI